MEGPVTFRKILPLHILDWDCHYRGFRYSNLDWWQETNFYKSESKCEADHC